MKKHAVSVPCGHISDAMGVVHFLSDVEEADSVRAAALAFLYLEDRWSPNDEALEEFARAERANAVEDEHQVCDGTVAEMVDSTDDDDVDTAMFDNIVHQRTSNSTALRSTCSLDRPQAADSDPHSTRAARSR